MMSREPLIYSERPGSRSRVFRFKVRIARNGGLLRKFAAQKLDILDTGYEFANRSEAPQVCRVGNCTDRRCNESHALHRLSYRGTATWVVSI